MARQAMKKTACVSVITMFIIHLVSASITSADTSSAPPAKVTPLQPKPLKAEPVKPLPRIKARAGTGMPGEFYRQDTGERFVPDGFNYTVLGEGHKKGWHATFNADVYDPKAIEEVLTRMRDLGANVIRVWAWDMARNGGGFIGNAEDRGLNGKHLANFTDFLRRANRHGIYVIPILDETPHNAYYDYLASIRPPKETDAAFTGYNRQYLTTGLIVSKAAAIRDFITYVKAADPGLLSTVLAWHLSNEISVNCTQGPFSASSGIVTPANGKSYDMASKQERQSCWDDSIVHWANELTKAVKAVDPDSLVTAGMWTTDVVVDRQPFNGLLERATDARFPPRPSVLAARNCLIDFLDIHVYPWHGKADINKATHEWDALCKSGKPVLLGEYGAFTSTPVEQAREQALTLRRKAKSAGYAGFLFWNWDLRTTGCYVAEDHGFAELLASQFKIYR